MIKTNVETFNEETIRDIIEWDVTNWSKALLYWDNYIAHNKLTCLELGARSGGLSLWLSLNGHDVICSDINNPTESASSIHKMYKTKGAINYESINAINIPYENHFDIIVFKSILGGIGSFGNKELINKTIEQIFKALKPGGVLLFAENLKATIFHQIARRVFVNWGNRWNYIEYEEVDNLFNKFSSVSYDTYGFFSSFGRNEKIRNRLSILDKQCNAFIPKSAKYILFGAAKK